MNGAVAMGGYPLDISLGISPHMTHNSYKDAQSE
jgi:hypothetical protein